MRAIEDQAEEALGENTPVKLGLLLVILAIMGSGAAGSIWWASRTSTQIEQIQGMLKDYQSIGAVNASKIIDINERLRIIETQGSPALLGRLTSAEASLARLKEEFEVHKVINKP